MLFVYLFLNTNDKFILLIVVSPFFNVFLINEQCIVSANCYPINRFFLYNYKSAYAFVIDLISKDDTDILKY